jgi:hypothetical protein
MNLFAEGEALSSFASTSIGRHPLFRVVRVLHHSPKCLIEEVAEGKTVAATLDNDQTPVSQKEETKRILLEYHKCVFSAFVYDGLIHSDIHLGNAVRTLPPGGDADGFHGGFALFDVGQFERVSSTHVRRALLWTLSWISTPERRTLLRSVALSHLRSVSTLGGDADLRGDAGAPLSDRERGAKLTQLLGEAFDEAIEPLSDGSLPDQRVAYMLLLRAAERRSIVLPDGSFAIAKMLDGILSQQANYNLDPIIDAATRTYLLKELTFADVCRIGWAMCT